MNILLKIFLLFFTVPIQCLGILLILSAINTWISYDFYPEYAAFSPRAIFPMLDGVGLVVNWGLVVIQATVGIYCFKINDYIPFGTEEPNLEPKPKKKYPY